MLIEFKKFSFLLCYLDVPGMVELGKSTELKFFLRITVVSTEAPTRAVL